MPTTPFTILIDAQEQQPWSFTNIRSDAVNSLEIFHVPTKWKQLGIRSGNNYEPRGDYSIEGFEGRCHIERKSVVDLQSTILGWDGRRDRFKHELSVLAGFDYSMVIVEGTLGACIATCRQFGKKSADDNKKILNRSIIAFMQDYKVPWLFCDSRRLAEIEAFRFLLRAHEKMTKQK